MTDNKKLRVPVIKPKRSKGQEVEYEEKELIDLHTQKEFKKILSVDKDTLMAEIILSYPELSILLMNAGMHCVGCPASSFESLGDGCAVHGMNDAEIDELVLKLNEEITKINAKGDMKRCK